MKNIFLLIAISLLILPGCNFLGSGSAPSNPVEVESEPQEVLKIQYLDYSPEAVKDLEGKKPFALFFYAAWCPSCRALDEIIKKNLVENGDIIIVKTNYDEEIELKKTYGVTLQDTFVFFDADGSVFDKITFPKITDIQKIFDSLK